MPYIIASFFPHSLFKKCFSVPALAGCICFIDVHSFVFQIFTLFYLKFILFMPIFKILIFILIFTILLVKHFIFNCCHSFALSLYYYNFIIKL